MLKQYDSKSAQETILKRVSLDETSITPAMQERMYALFGEALTPVQAVERILKDVRQNGDEALLRWTATLDNTKLSALRVSQAEIEAALAAIPVELRQAIEQSVERVRRFHQAQPMTSWLNQSLGGTLGQLVRPIRRVGLYIPAGSAPLPSSIVMSAIPAQVAGVSEIVLVAPPDRSSGKIAPVILAAAAICGIPEIYSLGGAQAIAALAYGTESIPAVDKIFGPGNLFVSLAKRQVYGTVGIDSIAGPTETVVIADESANPTWVAADLLAQAEHDVLAAAILLSPSAGLIRNVQQEVEKQVQQRGRAEIITQSLSNRSGAVLTASLDEALALANAYGPEHLCLSVKEPWALAEKVTSAGGIFVGESSCEVLGDYVAGPSHVMPTSGSARFNSPLNVLDFVHIISLVALNPETTAKIAPIAAIIAQSEGLDAHAYAAQVRCEKGAQ